MAGLRLRDTDQAERNKKHQQEEGVDFIEMHAASIGAMFRFMRRFTQDPQF